MAANGLMTGLEDAPMAEQGFVGALLLSPMMTGEMLKVVSVDDLTDSLSRQTYGAMTALWNRGIGLTLESIADEMDKRGKPPPNWGTTGSELLTLQARTSWINPASYVAAIHEHSLRRRVVLRCRQAQEIAIDPDVPAQDALDQAKELFATVDVPMDSENESVSMPEFCAGQDEWDWLVPDLIERGDRLLIVAAEGQGKSMLARQMAVCCAIGVHPFGGHSYDPMRVLILDLENPVTLGRRKLRPMYATARRLRPQADHSNLLVICKPGGIDVTRRSDARWLSSQLTHTKPDLVVLGPLYKLASGDDNWERGAARVTALLDDLRDRMNFGLVMETHAPQGVGGSRSLRPVGSSMWLRWPEFILTFAPLETDPEKVRVSITKGRDERNWPTFLGRGRGGDWPWMPCGEQGPIDRAVAPADEEF